MYPTVLKFLTCLASYIGIDLSANWRQNATENGFSCHFYMRSPNTNSCLKYFIFWSTSRAYKHKCKFKHVFRKQPTFDNRHEGFEARFGFYGQISAEWHIVHLHGVFLKRLTACCLRFPYIFNFLYAWHLFSIQYLNPVVFFPGRRFVCWILSLCLKQWGLIN